MSLSRDERDELQSSARALLARESPSERVRTVIGDSAGFDRDLWDQMVELGWTSVHVDAELGGGGAGYAELGVLLHELGRSLAPSPFLASAVLATAALTSAARTPSDNDSLAKELLVALTNGELVGSVAFASAGGSYEPSCLTTGWEWADGRVRIRGSAGFVLDADVADVLVVAARDADGTLAIVAVDRSVPGVGVEHAETVDATRRLFTVSFDGVFVPEDRMLCEPGARAEELFEQILAVGAIAAACDATGVAEQALEQAVRHATDRVQFGKPIGTFQAVKHHCANIAIAVAASGAAVRGACEALDGDPREWARSAAVTSSFVGPACAEACALALRVHGGLGFTWEHDSHLYLKRVQLDQVLFGTPSWHRRRLASAVIAGAQEVGDAR
jgi:alkylation response protein AidB-like acyl-CoA dehydrogenase